MENEVGTPRQLRFVPNNFRGSCIKHLNKCIKQKAQVYRNVLDWFVCAFVSQNVSWSKPQVSFASICFKMLFTSFYHIPGSITAIHEVMRWGRHLVQPLPMQSGTLDHKPSFGSKNGYQSWPVVWAPCYPNDPSQHCMLSAWKKLEQGQFLGYLCCRGGQWSRFLRVICTQENLMYSKCIIMIQVSSNLATHLPCFAGQIAWRPSDSLITSLFFCPNTK